MYATTQAIAPAALLDHVDGVLRDHLRADEKALAHTVFPGGEA